MTKEPNVNTTAPQTETSKAASAALWTASAALAVAAVGKLALYGRFRRSASDACDAAVGREPAGGWPDASFPCEQFAPMGWILPYWLTIAAYAVFAVLFAVAAVRAARTGRGAARFTAVTAALAALLCVVPGVFGLSWAFAEATANEADRIVAELIRDDVPGWFTALEIVTLMVALAASIAAVVLQRRGRR
jgi:hypothetical protein